jgi:4-hydroxybenzoyl-CoA reductase subunit beta
MEKNQIYHKAKNVDDAMRFALEHKEDFRYIAGGTDLNVNRFHGTIQTSCLIDIHEIEELREIKGEGNDLHIGALVTLDELIQNPIIKKDFPALAEAAHSVATPMLRKTATIGGNILCENRCIFFNQSEWWREAVGYCLKCEGEICIATGGTKACFSKFVSDTAPVLICLDARIVIADKGKQETMKLEDVYTGDGLKPNKLSNTALVLSIIIPLSKNYTCAFQKLRPRESVDFTSLTTAVSVDEAGRIKVAVGGVDPKPIVTEGKSLEDRDDMIKFIIKKSRVVDNDYYTRPYRRLMIDVLLKRCFKKLSS